MAKPKATLGAKWMSESDVQTVLNKARSNRQAQDRLLGSLSDKLDKRKGEIERSLSDLPAAKRSATAIEAVVGYRSELKRESAATRMAYTREAGRIAEQVKGVAALYKSPMQMLARDTIGSERRSRILEQIKMSGPVELASLAEYAAAKMDMELGAALCSRVADMPRADRPFSSSELAEALVGQKHRTVANALDEIERTTLEAVHFDSAFETGRSNPRRSVQLAMMKRREAGDSEPETEEEGA